MPVIFNKISNVQFYPEPDAGVKICELREAEKAPNRPSSSADIPEASSFSTISNKTPQTERPSLLLLCDSLHFRDSLLLYMVFS